MFSDVFEPLDSRNLLLASNPSSAFRHCARVQAQLACSPGCRCSRLGNAPARQFHALPRVRSAQDTILHRALSLLDDEHKSDEKLDAVNWSKDILACVESRQWEKALLFLPESRMISFSAAISACELTGQWEQALLLLNKMRTISGTPAVSSFNAAMLACDKGRQWEQVMFLFQELHEFCMKPDAIGFTTAILACEKCQQWEQALLWLQEMHDLNVTHSTADSAGGSGLQWQRALSFLENMQQADVTPTAVIFNAAISVCEKCKQWEPALSLLDEMHNAGTTFDEVALKRQHLLLSSSGMAPFNEIIKVSSADEWNTWAKELFPEQPALLLDQLDLRDKKAYPLLNEFWMALKHAVDAEQEEGYECLYRIQDGEIFCRENEDAMEQWYLASQDEGEASEETEEVLAGMRSVELPAKRFPRSQALIKVPAELLTAYKLEIMNFMLQERGELRAILEREKEEKRDDFTVQWEHRVLRRSFDGEFVKQQNLRFHRDSVPEDITNDDGVLCAYTVLTVLENYDPFAKEDQQENSVEQAGTVFKLDPLFGTGKRDDPEQTVTNSPLEKPQRGDRYVYWHSRSTAGVTTIFCNSDGKSMTDDEVTTIWYYWTPQMWHSVAEVIGRNTTAFEDNRSRTVLQTKVTFCGLPVVSKEAEVAKRLQSIGLGPYLNESLIYVERRFDNGYGPYSFQEFLDYYGEMDIAAAHWYAGVPATTNTSDVASSM